MSRLLRLVGLTLLLVTTSARAQTHTLNSEYLEVEVTEEPYGFEVREAASGEVLLTHAETAFREGTRPRPVEGAEEVTEVIRSGESLSEGEYDAEANRLTVPFLGATTLRPPGASSIF